MNFHHRNITILLALVITFFSFGASASYIGSGIVVGSGSLTTNINWNDAFPGSASGTINGIVIRGRVLPVLNMSISGSGVLDLGNLSSTAYSTGSIQIEVGTNAVNGASVTAASTNGGMTNTSNTGNVINDLVADGFADSYRFTSVISVANDSSAPGFAQTGGLATEINSTTPVTVYTSNKPQNLTGVNDVDFYVSAMPNVQTPAGDYSDIIVITVTGNF